MRRHGKQPGIGVIPGQEFGLNIELKKIQPEPITIEEPAAAGGSCVSDITGVVWKDISISRGPDPNNPPSLGTSVQRELGPTSGRPLGPWELAGVPIGDICPDCTLTWSLTSGPGLIDPIWSQAGNTLVVVAAPLIGVVTLYVISAGTYVWTLSVDCPDSGQSGTVGTLTLIANQEESPD